jgi:hypothetical protein
MFSEVGIGVGRAVETASAIAISSCVNQLIFPDSPAGNAANLLILLTVRHWLKG